MNGNLSPVSMAAGPRFNEARIILVAIAALNAICLLFVWRRFAGPYTGPVWPPVVVVAGVLTAAAAGLLRKRWRTNVAPLPDPEHTSTSEWIVAWGPSLAVILATIAFSWPPLERILDSLVWVPIWIADMLWRKIFVADSAVRAEPAASEHPPRPTPDSPQPAPLTGTPEQPCDVEGAAAPSHEPHGLEPHGDEPHGDHEPADAPHEHVLQKLTRVKDPTGREIIYGTIRAELQPGERSASLHVAFCPPLDAPPTFELEQVDGPASRIKAGQVLPYGARIDVRVVGKVDTESSIAIEWAALGGEPDQHADASE